MPATICIDHNHQTGVFRGILCLKCNAGIGMFNENTQVLRKAIIYLIYLDVSIAKKKHLTRISKTQ